MAIVAARTVFFPICGLRSFAGTKLADPAAAEQALTATFGGGREDRTSRRKSRLGFSSEAAGKIPRNLQVWPHPRRLLSEAFAGLSQRPEMARTAEKTRDFELFSAHCPDSLFGLAKAVLSQLSYVPGEHLHWTTIDGSAHIGRGSPRRCNSRAMLQLRGCEVALLWLKICQRAHPPAAARAGNPRRSLAIQKWAHQDSNLGPRPYQGRALTN